MRYAVGLPHTGAFSGRFLDSIVGLECPNHDSFYLIRVPDLPVDEARNQIVERFLAKPELEYLLMVDSDMVFAPQSLTRLAYRIEPEIRLGCGLDDQVDMVAALTFTRYSPPCPTIFRGVDRVENGHEYLYIQIEETLEWLEKWPAAQECPTVLPGVPLDAMVRADATGCAFVLFSRRVFEAIPAPWFVRDGLKRGEDLYYFERARKAGFRLWVDRSVVVGHQWGEQFIGPQDFIAYHTHLPDQAVT